MTEITEQRAATDEEITFLRGMLTTNYPPTSDAERDVLYRLLARIDAEREARQKDREYRARIDVPMEALCMAMVMAGDRSDGGTDDQILRDAAALIATLREQRDMAAEAIRKAIGWLRLSDEEMSAAESLTQVDHAGLTLGECLLKLEAREP